MLLYYVIKLGGDKLIENFTRYKFEPIYDYSQFIEELFELYGYCYPKDYRKYKDYYLAYNPLVEDRKTMSAQIYIKDGILVMYNGSIDVERKGRKVSSNSITPSEYSRILDKFDLYIDFVISWYGINLTMFNEYKNLLVDYVVNQVKFDWKKNRGIENMRRLLFNNFITDRDVMMYNSDKELKDLIRIFKKEPKQIFEKNSITLRQPMSFNRKMIEQYCAKRHIDFSDNVYPVMVNFEDKYSEPAVCFKYIGGFKKLRFIDSSLNRRYMAYARDGEYDYFFEVKNLGSSKCFVVEGEIEGITISKIIDEDVYAMHNVNSLPTYLTQLKKYDKIIVKVDYDKYESVKESFTRLFDEYGSKVTIEPKIICIDKAIDYNSLFVDNKLNKDIIYNITKYNEDGD